MMTTNLSMVNCNSSSNRKSKQTATMLLPDASNQYSGLRVPVPLIDAGVLRVRGVFMHDR